MLTFILLANTDPAIPTQPGLRPGLTEDQITPGLLGFVVTFGIVLAMVFLIRDMVKRIRRVRYQAQVAGELGGKPTEYMGIPLMSEAEMDSAAYNNEFRDAEPGKHDGGTPVPVSTLAPGAEKAGQHAPAPEEK